MLRIIIFITTTLLSCSHAIAGFGYDNPYSYDSVITPIQLENEGIYNLVISVQIMNEPYEKKAYESDEYRDFIKRLSVEWSNVAVDIVLNSKVKKIEDLARLKTSIEDEITKLAESLKQKYSLEKNIEVVFSISNFYLLDPKMK